jgi:NAD(P)-dependent dehydrogenase (short-subunit alcohol dehydrogenase family)
MSRLAPLFDLRGKRALVTGGNSGIGAAMASALGLAGARVVLVARREAELQAAAQQLRAEGIEADTLSADLADVAALRAAAQAAGDIDILVNAAGINLRQPFAEVTPEAWQTQLALHLGAPFFLTQALAPGMAARGWGRIVNIASVAGKEGNPNAPAYSASKAGVIGLTKSLGKELAATNIRVNAVAPAAIDTEMLAQVTPEFRAMVIAKIPMGRLGRAGEVADIVNWLASAECSFCTGAVFDVSGGRATY